MGYLVAADTRGFPPAGGTGSFETLPNGGHRATRDQSHPALSVVVRRSLHGEVCGAGEHAFATELGKAQAQ